MENSKHVNGTGTFVIMDTDELSNETYEGVFITAEKFHHDLTLQFGVIAGNCEDEEEYLQTARELIKELKEMEEYEMEKVFFEEIPTIASFHEVLDIITANIQKVMTIPKEKRTFEEY